MNLLPRVFWESGARKNRLSFRPFFPPPSSPPGRVDQPGRSGLVWSFVFGRFSCFPPSTCLHSLDRKGVSGRKEGRKEGSILACLSDGFSYVYSRFHALCFSICSYACFSFSGSNFVALKCLYTRKKGKTGIKSNDLIYRSSLFLCMSVRSGTCLPSCLLPPFLSLSLCSLLPALFCPFSTKELLRASLKERSKGQRHKERASKRFQHSVVFAVFPSFLSLSSFLPFVAPLWVLPLLLSSLPLTYPL